MTHSSENPLPRQESGRVFVGRQPELDTLRSSDGIGAPDVAQVVPDVRDRASD